MLETLATDYVRTSRALGFSPRQIFFGDALRNALIPVLTLRRHRARLPRRGQRDRRDSCSRGPASGATRSGPSPSNDFNAIQGFILLVAAIYVLLNLAIDLLYAVIDPRIRLG